MVLTQQLFLNSDEFVPATIMHCMEMNQIYSLTSLGLASSPVDVHRRGGN